MEIDKDYICNGCNRETKELWQYKPYDKDRHPELCKKCFDKYEKEINNE